MRVVVARRLVARLARRAADVIVVESTGGYERALTEALSAADLPVVLVRGSLEGR